MVVLYSCPTLRSNDMTTRYTLAVVTLTAIYQRPCSSQKLPHPLPVGGSISSPLT